MNDTRRIIVLGSPAEARALAQMLRDDGVLVVWEPPLRREPGAYGAGIEYAADVQHVIVSLLSVGIVAAVKATIAKYHRGHPETKVILEGEDEDTTENQ